MLQQALATRAAPVADVLERDLERRRSEARQFRGESVVTVSPRLRGRCDGTNFLQHHSDVNVNTDYRPTRLPGAAVAKASKGAVQYNEWRRHAAHPTYLGNPSLTPFICVSKTRQSSQLSPRSSNRFELKALSACQPHVNRKVQSRNPICYTLEEQRAANASARNKADQLPYDAVTGRIDDGAIRNVLKNPTISDRTKRQALMRSQQWSMFAPPNGTGFSSRGFGKGGRRMPGGGSSVWNLVGGSSNALSVPGMSETGQSADAANTASARAALRRAGEAPSSAARSRQLGAGAMSVLLGSRRGDEELSPRRRLRRAAPYSPRSQNHCAANGPLCCTYPSVTCDA